MFEDEEKIKHESFGTLHVSRRSGGDGRLFGSPLRHQHHMAITLKTASMSRSLSNDWIFSDKVVAEVEMSEAQWAQFVSSPNVGGGVPCTIRYRHTEGFKAMEDVPEADGVKTTFEKEVKARADEYAASARELVPVLDAILAGATIKKADLKALRDRLDTIATGMPNSMKFMYEQFERTMDKTVCAAKADIEAHFIKTVMQAGIDALTAANDRPTLIDG